MAKKFNDPGFLQLNKYDFGAVYYNWHMDEVESLKTLLNETGAKIVPSSDWKRGRSFEDLKRLFKIHGLDEYLIDMTPNMTSRCEEIETYLASHSDIKNSVILDDYKFLGHENLVRYLFFVTFFLKKN